jgi:hypothetical protein
MAFPLIFSPNGEIIARINHDGTWSVRWDRVVDIAYQTPHPRRIAIIAYTKLLLAARDNFCLTAWNDKMPEWIHFQAEIDYIDHDPKPGNWQSTISYNGNLIARVNYDGFWSIRWDEVLDISRWSATDYRSTALVGLCRIFKAAKDRFVTSPWDLPEDDD